MAFSTGSKDKCDEQFPRKNNTHWESLLEIFPVWHFFNFGSKISFNKCDKAIKVADVVLSQSYGKCDEGHVFCHEQLKHLIEPE